MLYMYRESATPKKRTIQHLRFNFSDKKIECNSLTAAESIQEWDDYYDRPDPRSFPFRIVENTGKGRAVFTIFRENLLWVERWSTEQIYDSYSDDPTGPHHTTIKEYIKE